MKQHWRTLLTATAVALLTVVWNWPAHWVVSELESATGGRLRVLNTQGTLWAGSAQLGLFDGSKVYAIPDTLEWKWVMATPEVDLGLQFNHPRLDNPLHLGLKNRGITLSAGQLRLPAGWLVALGAPFNTIRPEGLLKITWAATNWAAPVLDLQVIWQDAQSALASIRPLGAYQVRASGRVGEMLTVELSTLQGALQMQGKGQWRPGQRLEFKGEAWSDETNRAALTGLLSQMGRLDGQRYKLGVF